MKLIIPLLLMVSSLCAQNAQYNNFSPSAVRGVTIGAYHCYFWFGSIVPSPYTFESACYSPTGAPVLQFVPPGMTITEESFNFCLSGESPWPPCMKSGSIIWTISPNGTKWNFTISGQGPDDTLALLQTGTI